MASRNTFTAVDLTVSTASALTQPCTLALVSLFGVMGVSQQYPDLFVPKEHRGRITFKHPVSRLLLPPLACAAVGYAVAATIIHDGDIVRGHVISLGSSVAMAAWGLLGFRISHACTAVGMVYGTFGYYYNYKAITLLTDGAPWYCVGDGSAVVQSVKQWWGQ